MNTTHESHAGNVNLVGGRLCLDFTNTIGRQTDPYAYERLNSYHDLLRWSEHAGILGSEKAALLLDKANHRPEEATAIYDWAMRLRGTIWRVFYAASQNQNPPPDDLRTLNDALATALSHSRIVEANGGYALGWRDAGKALDRMLWPIVRSAADLLTSGDIERVRVCDGHDCEWLFVDTSRNHSRRWCEMETCGNRAKARRYYERNR